MPGKYCENFRCLHKIVGLGLHFCRFFKQSIFKVQCRSNNFSIGGEGYHCTNMIEAEKCISYASFWLKVHCIVYFIYLFLFLKITKIKAIKEEIQNNTKDWTNPL